MKAERFLTRPEQYRLVYDKGAAWVNSLVVMRAMPNGSGFSRYGISVSRRVGNAVTRNRVKRLLREILRLTPILPGWDMVFIARPAAAGKDYATLARAVKRLLGQARLLPPAEGAAEGESETGKFQDTITKQQSKTNPSR
ncbi:MAG: ribonuclease P protein component [Chloroflexi bacterium]|nr:ribonuclease P protein component [Chloroflexota bacterium]